MGSIRSVSDSVVAKFEELKRKCRVGGAVTNDSFMSFVLSAYEQRREQIEEFAAARIGALVRGEDPSLVGVTVEVVRGDDFHCTMEDCPDTSQPVRVAMLSKNGSGDAHMLFCCEQCWPKTQQRLEEFFTLVPRDSHTGGD